MNHLVPAITTSQGEEMVVLTDASPLDALLGNIQELFLDGCLWYFTLL